jgi:hypothetical protein
MCGFRCQDVLNISIQRLYKNELEQIVQKYNIPVKSKGVKEMKQGLETIVAAATKLVENETFELQCNSFLLSQ